MVFFQLIEIIYTIASDPVINRTWVGLYIALHREIITQWRPDQLIGNVHNRIDCEINPIKDEI